MTTLDKTWGGHPTPSQAAALLRKYARDKRLPPNDNNFDDAAAIIDRLAALSSIPEQGVGVKPLEWEVAGDGFVREEAECVLGLYRLAQSRITGTWRWSLNALDWPWSLELPTCDDAKAAAQVDYEASIRSALAPSNPAAVVVTNEMVNRALDAWYASPGDSVSQMESALEAVLVDRDRVK